MHAGGFSTGIIRNRKYQIIKRLLAMLSDLKDYLYSKKWI